ncbi:uncharacterized protein LOC112576894 isoform X24 [Pomacea canaliculata]|uniref:uncharacterized protein LOC112576894 isoform X23 n=2 Tax=Pomacea canaliculata TaxID=400727 RepID=UPI000D73C554|nr:uncharacterized protein LOC112576894 isoform X23 [Pomacea canaliculata]XP_025115535.1 uncharacterized protein LOC112576894 isoform X24 [Pomacea canaliculata]
MLLLQLAHSMHGNKKERKTEGIGNSGMLLLQLAHSMHGRKLRCRESESERDGNKKERKTEGIDGNKKERKTEGIGNSGMLLLQLAHSMHGRKLRCRESESERVASMRAWLCMHVHI